MGWIGDGMPVAPSWWGEAPKRPSYVRSVLAAVPMTSLASPSRRRAGPSVKPADEPVVVDRYSRSGTSWANGSAAYRPISNRGVQPLRALDAT
jgi:hypothetical protein